MCGFAHCNCHPGLCNKLITVYPARYLLMIRCNLSLILLLVKHILQDINPKAQNRKYKQPLILLVIFGEEEIGKNCTCMSIYGFILHDVLWVALIFILPVLVLELYLSEVQGFVNLWYALFFPETCLINFWGDCFNHILNCNLVTK